MKRAFDVALSAAGLVVSLPLWVLFAAAVKMEDGGPVFFTQERVGLNGRIFRALKFRSMIPDAEARTGPVQAAARDGGEQGGQAVDVAGIYLVMQQ